MAKYKPYSYGQGQFIPVFFSKQILPGTFEFALNQLIDNKLDLSIFDKKFKNDETGAPAYDPRILLKIILFAYSRGITSSRVIARCCEQNIVFMALSAHSCPHFTTIANFISSMDKEITTFFQEVILVCDEAGLIGREMFAIDGCKLPSNASKEWSGTRNDFKKKAVKLEQAIERIVTRHRKTDSDEPTAKLIKDKEEQYVETLDKQLKKVRIWLRENEDRTGSRKSIIKSNITDNESAKMKTSKGVIQGYNGVTMVDDKKQIIVAAEAYGHSHEQAVLEPMIDQTRENLPAATKAKEDVFTDGKLTADSGFHSEQNMKMLADNEIDAYVADPQMRRRDPRFDHSGRYKIQAQKERKRRNPRDKKFTPDDFTFDADLKFCTCPAGKKLYRSWYLLRGCDHEATKFKTPKSACSTCDLRSQCLRYPERTEIRQVAYFHGRFPKAPETCINRMKRKIDTAVGQMIYSKRIATAEPPFAQIRHILKLDRFSLRGKKKVNCQWLLFCAVYNLKRLYNCEQVAVT
jgi:transposase